MALTAEQIAALTAQLTSIQKARNSGVLMVRHGETMTTFRNLSEMDTIIARLQDTLNGASTPRIRYPVQLTKGL